MTKKGFYVGSETKVIKNLDFKRFLFFDAPPPIKIDLIRFIEVLEKKMSLLNAAVPAKIFFSTCQCFAVSSTERLTERCLLILLLYHKVLNVRSSSLCIHSLEPLCSIGSCYWLNTQKNKRCQLTGQTPARRQSIAHLSYHPAIW